MNIVIAGDGEVGFHLASSLSKVKHNITVVDPNSELLKMLEADSDLLTIAGNSTSLATLREAGVANCDLLISVLHQESINIITCMLGKRLGAKRTIARVNTQEYLNDINKGMFRGMGVDELVCPEKIAAKEISNLLTRNVATELFDFSNGLLCIYMLRIDHRALVINKTLIDVAKEYPDLGIRTVCIIRKGRTIIPKGDEKYVVNDLVYLIAKPDSINKIKQLGGKEDHNLRSAIIVGGGRIGRRAAINLHNKLDLKIIEKDIDRCNRLANEFDDVMIINGDGSDVSLLQDEGIRTTDAFISLTQSTETNIMSCLYAHRQGVKKTIALVENVNYIDVSQDIGIDTIINKKLITASYIARFTLGGEITASKWLSGIDAEVVEVVAKQGSPITKKQLKDIKFPEGVNIGGLIRNGKAIIAQGQTQIEPNDKVVAFTIPESAHKFVKLLS
ncbi:MAG: Trk system potassium transporter TrkA [Bacteroidales bacterium]|nr:Trk system potassium transporter TrkA [Bacteroidales bacterium]MDD4001539.1 Trk system potassium transporter TrkA [Bacteroidales bacterium]MDD4529378.1 Trk system potassium transporter TrkA [Bacteroidales bacterium]MDD4829332.1 Trk system potassium transporter TrkA [Bacteroidales bacterium]